MAQTSYWTRPLVVLVNARAIATMTRAVVPTAKTRRRFICYLTLCEPLSTLVRSVGSPAAHAAALPLCGQPPDNRFERGGAQFIRVLVMRIVDWGLRIEGGLRK